MNLETLETRFKVLKNRMKWVLIISLIWILVMAIINSVLWEHWVVEVLALLPFLPIIWLVLASFKVENQIEKIKPKKDFPLVQTDPIVFKKAIKIIRGIQYFLLIVLICFVVVILGKSFDLVETNLEAPLGFITLLIMFNLVLLMQLEERIKMERMQYEKYYHLIPTKEDIKDEQLDR